MKVELQRATEESDFVGFDVVSGNFLLPFYTWLSGVRGVQHSCQTPDPASSCVSFCGIYLQGLDGFCTL